MPGFKDIIKKERLDIIEKHQIAVDQVVSKRLGTFKRDLEAITELLEERTLRGRFKRLVKWLG